jgi:ABC-type Fe3+/spermidine/putrescine transport system ATPase subunit
LKNFACLELENFNDRHLVACMLLEVVNLTKSYETRPLLKGVSFSIQAGETLCLLGASGSGKSTILRIVAGLETAEEGEVRWKGNSLANIPTYRRNFGLMFQDYALFPHLNVFENVAFGLRMQGWAEKEIQARVLEVVKQANLLPAFEKRRVAELSGGEQQRVALARALAPRPELLMLDEPLGALDRSLRESLIEELRAILKRSGIPAIYVTHDQQEAFTIADKIILLNDGRVVQEGSAPEVFEKPANGWVASFLGLGNVVQGQVGTDGIETPCGLIKLKTGLQTGQNVTLLLRPQAEQVDDDATWSGVVTDVIYRGQEFRVEFENGWYFHVANAPKIGQQVSLKVKKMELL